MKTIRTVLRSFVLGAIAGLLIAPRSGRETREMLRDRVDTLLDGSMSGSGGDFGADDSGAGMSV